MELTGSFSSHPRSGPQEKVSGRRTKSFLAGWCLGRSVAFPGVFLLVRFAGGPGHHPPLVPHLGICLLQASEVSNWLFNRVQSNWVLITILHSVLIFKSVLSSERKASHSPFSPPSCCLCAVAQISPLHTAQSWVTHARARGIHWQGLIDKDLLMASSLIHSKY